MEFTSENLVKAVEEFYKQEETLNIECHEWLKNCQSSKEAWTLVWPLLQSSQGLHVHFIAANILHYKVSRQLAELPTADYLALKDNLVAAVAQFINGPPLVLTRLQLTVGLELLNVKIVYWDLRIISICKIARCIYCQYDRAYLAKPIGGFGCYIPSTQFSRCSRRFCNQTPNSSFWLCT